MYRKGGRGTHQELWNHPVRPEVPIPTGTTGCPPLMRWTTSAPTQQSGSEPSMGHADRSDTSRVVLIKLNASYEIKLSHLPLSIPPSHPTPKINQNNEKVANTTQIRYR